METRIIGAVVGMRAWGFLIAPAIAGYLADPLQVRNCMEDNSINVADSDDGDNFNDVTTDTMSTTVVPTVDISSSSSSLPSSMPIIHYILEDYPYILPNLLGSNIVLDVGTGCI